MVKYKTYIDPDGEEMVLIYAKERTSLVDELERLAGGEWTEIIGYSDGVIVRLDPYEAECFIVEDGRVYALIGGKRLWVKERLYMLEEALDHRFVKLNQSCIANIGKIKSFDTTLAGSIIAIFESGYRDYISRRQLRTVKERIGFKR